MILLLGAPGTRVACMRLSFAYFGAPFCIIPASDNLDMKRMDFTYFGCPIVTYAKG